MEEEPVFKTRRKGKSLTQTVLIPSETIVADALRALPPGAVSDLAAMRRALAARYGADACCPVTVQRHLLRLSRHGTAPFWRVIDPDRPFAGRMEGGPERIRKEQAAER